MIFPIEIFSLCRKNLFLNFAITLFFYLNGIPIETWISISPTQLFKVIRVICSCFTCRIKFLKRMPQKTFYETFCGIIDEILLSFKLHVFQKNFQDLKSFSFWKFYLSCGYDVKSKFLRKLFHFTLHFIRNLVYISNKFAFERIISCNFSQLTATSFKLIIIFIFFVSLFFLSIRRFSAVLT